jgi:hypothetical protein
LRSGAAKKTLRANLSFHSGVKPNNIKKEAKGWDTEKFVAPSPPMILNGFNIGDVQPIVDLNISQEIQGCIHQQFPKSDVD